MALSRKVQNRLIVVGAVVALLLGIGLLAYPFVSNALLDSAQGKVLHTQQDAVANSSEEDLSAAREFALQYNRDLVGSRTVVTDPFDETALRPTDGSYDEALNIAGDGVMGTLYIPRIHVEEPIYHTVDDDVLQKGVGHLEETSLPIGGPSSHCVLSGHTGLPSGKIFDDLDRLEVGDYFIIQVLGEDHAYRIYDIETVLPDETQSLVIQPDRDLCTLVTCTPYGVNTHRLLVHGERCDVPAEWLERDADGTFPSGYSQPMDRTIVPSVLCISHSTISSNFSTERRHWFRKRSELNVLITTEIFIAFGFLAVFFENGTRTADHFPGFLSGTPLQSAAVQEAQPVPAHPSSDAHSPRRFSSSARICCAAHRIPRFFMCRFSPISESI